MLKAAVQQEPGDLTAWLWLSGAVESDEERLLCLRRVLEIDPQNKTAARGVAQLVGRGAVSLPKSSSPAPAKASVVPATVRPIFSHRPSLAPTLAVAAILLIILGAYWLFTWTFFTGTILLVMTCLGAGPGVLALVIVGDGLIRCLTTRYTLTTRDLIVDKGFISRSHHTIPVHRIQDVAYSQGLLQRLLGVGDVRVESAGERGEVHLVDLASCQKRSQQILKLIQQAPDV